jgi:hypothetical protein
MQMIVRRSFLWRGTCGGQWGSLFSQMG